MPIRSLSPLISIDTSLKALPRHEVTAAVADAYVAAYAFNLVEMERSVPFIISLVTHDEDLWLQLLVACQWTCWLRSEGCGVAVFEPDSACGATRVYQWTPHPGQRRLYPAPHPANLDWKAVDSETQLIALLDLQDRPKKYEEWAAHQAQTLALPTQFAEGRMENTTVERSIVMSRGDGCAFCGQPAPGYVGTTICNGKLFVQLPACPQHVAESKAAPTVLSLIAELLHAQIDLPVLWKLDHIPDECIAPIVSFLASRLGEQATEPEERKNGWHATIKRVSGWSWILRLKALHDYAYMLMDPQGNERYRIDSAPDHPEIPFGPSHRHSAPRSKKDQITPSFTYGIPLFDIASLKRLAEQHESNSC